MHRESRINPLTCEPERRARFLPGAIVLRLTAGEMEAVEFASQRGYLPPFHGRNIMNLRYREDGSGSVRITRQWAYQWAEWAESDPHAFCACLAPSLAALFHAADFRIRDNWAV